ncbi:cytochrome d ubiquinol oxidase subunit II [Goodfellowiella coeruleoviolacea]|uniref:Cytochrome bd-I ubiquinol oxidase subunit 2 apoprotein n=1 Tax=Goodfellowiella coeruleoviolacea TaxID=334858 RepID=A0AAE3KEQ1_9PSEU|nr:cytochrome d ubiquinol oxidase subunit II [Goodfellowiella coeruleoviolacea]MCP2165561.1 cytochrome bd-I ubiquinol oxidase subunit 2 apoprotein (EC 1.10.3.10) [Goodfellowiella coeruleoviolacea]
MTAAELLISVMWLGLTAYVLLAGADFGGGCWDLLAGGTRRGAAQRALIEESIGPVWEANHVWLIFVIVLCWTGFPGAFAAVASTMYIPLTLAALGIIARGAAFAFRKATTELVFRRAYGAAFALSSVLTPFFLGTVAGGIASGRVPPGIASGGIVRSWLNPTSLLGGALAVALAAYLAAVYLCQDARRAGSTALAEAFRRRALATAVVTGVLAACGIAILHADAPVLFHGLTGRGLPVVVVSALAGLASLVLLLLRHYLATRVTAAIAVAALLWGWAVAQYPLVLLPDLTIEAAAATPEVLRVTLVVTAVGAVLLVPSLVWLFALFQRPRSAAGERAAQHPGGR